MTETGYFRVIIDKKDDQIEQQQGTITDLQKENEELKAQIEKMKCCENCAFFKDKTYDICHRIKKLGTRKCAFYKMV